MSEPRQIHMKLEREDTPTHSIYKRWKYEIFVRHWKKYTSKVLILFLVCFAITWAIVGLENWWQGFFGIFILIFYVLKYVGIAFWFITSRAFLAYLFAPLIYFIIKYFIHVDKVAFRELGSKYTYSFKVTTLSDGYLLHEDRLGGLLKKPVYLDKVTVQYFKENGSERVFKEKGKKDKSFLELDIVPLSWKGDELYITDEQSGKRFLNNKILVTEHIRDYYALVVKGFNPSDREAEKGIIYDKILETSELKRQIIQLKRENKEMDIEHLDKVAEYLIPSPSDEFLRFKGLLREGTKDYDPSSKRIEQKTAMLELLMKGKGEEILTDEEVIRLVAADEID